MIWKTKDGREIPVSEMGDVHLSNAFQFVRRAKDRAEANYEHNKILICNAWLNVLALELAKRHLDKYDYEWDRPQ